MKKTSREIHCIFRFKKILQWGAIGIPKKVPEKYCVWDESVLNKFWGKTLNWGLPVSTYKNVLKKLNGIFLETWNFTGTFFKNKYY